MILVDALFVNKGGGAVLLSYLIERILAGNEKEKFFFLLDPRFEKPVGLDKNYTVIPNKISARIKFYKQNKNTFSKVFCFANTAPPVKLNIPVYTYLHNQKLLEAPKLALKPHFLFQYIKYLYIKVYNKNTNYYIVQTPHMVQLVKAIGLKTDANILTIPFYDNQKYLGAHTPFEQRVKDEFVFISNPTPQKNYPTLLDAWEYLLEKGITPRLHVTIDDTAPQFIDRVNALNERGARIINHKFLDPRELYFNCPYLIFPSIMESFGLPMMEAVESGMKVLASERPFVHDVIQPSITFEPMDKVSIANAVIKALNEELPFPCLVTKNEVNKLIDLLAANN
jgi:glycosyltransferase involved in cell wall biosynthesis